MVFEFESNENALSIEIFLIVLSFENFQVSKVEIEILGFWSLSLFRMSDILSL